MAIQMGISTGNKVAYGVVQTAGRKTSVSKVTATDETGKVTDTIAVSKKVERTLEFNWGAGEVPQPGEEVIIGGDTLMVDSLDENEKAGEIKTGNLTASNDDASTITPYVPPTA